jgi:hypothetical protein
VNPPDVVTRTVLDWLRRLRLRRQLDRAAVEVRCSAEEGDLDARVARRLLHHLAILRDELGGGGRTSSGADRHRRR